MRLQAMLRTTTILAALALPLALAAHPANAQEKPAPSDLQKHDTSPGATYVPQQDVLAEEKLEMPG